MIGVTTSSVDDALAFQKEHGAAYYLLADAQADQDAFGIDLIWGNQIYLINPEGKIVADTPGAVDKFLANGLS